MESVTDPNTTPLAPGLNLDEDELLAKFTNWEKALKGHWDKWQIEARMDYDFVAGRQWTDEEETQMREGSRVPVVINRIAPTVDAVCGAEIQSRQQVQYFPREVGDAAVNEILSQGADWIMDRCDGNEEDSDAFRDCIICGIGWTELRVDADLDTDIIKERISPLEMMVDPASRKSSFADARYLMREVRMSKDDAEEMAAEMGWPEGAFSTNPGLLPRKPVIVDPRIRYTGQNAAYNENEVYIVEWQWWDKEIVHLVDDGRGEIQSLAQSELDALLQQDPNVDSVRHSRKRYWRAWVGAGMLLGVQPIDTGDFTYTAVTGKRDETKNWWYGLVRPMRDPQRWANRFFSQMIHIMRHNSQGGVMAEEGAVDDIREFERSWADPAATTWFKNGALSNPAGARVQIKPQVNYPAGMDRLMEVAASGIRDATGVNQELLGLADRQQPGVLEQQRKQAAYGILSSFFDGLTRYRRILGRKLLKFMQLYLPPDKLVRVVGDDGSPQYVPLALSQQTEEYDVVVDEAPAGPNQKVQTFQVIMQLLPLLQQADMPDQFWSEIVKYFPLPASLTQKLATLLNQEGQENTPEAQMQMLMQQIQQRLAEADVAEKEGSARKSNAEAAKAEAEAQNQAMRGQMEMANGTTESEAKADLDRARTAKVLQDIINGMDENDDRAERNA